MDQFLFAIVPGRKSNLKQKNMIRNSEKTMLENSLVWSAHRSQTLGLCPRKYYHSFIGSWEGWDTSSPPEVQAAYHHKHLTTPDLQLGQIVHNRIRLILEAARLGRSIDPEVEVSMAQEEFRVFVKQSALRSIEHVTAKRSKFLLHEVGGDIDARQLKSFLDKIELLLRSFFAFEDVQRLIADPSVLLPEFLDLTEFEIDYDLGVPARPKTDAVFVALDKIIVVDWKCGGPSDEHREQGLIYDLLVRSRLALPKVETVEVRFYYLATGDIVAHSFSDDEREEKLWSIGEEYESLKSCSDDPKVNTGPESRFRARVNEACFRCNFQKICPEFLRSPFGCGKKVML